MCLYKEYWFRRCGHDIHKLQRCSKPTPCPVPLLHETYYHRGECKTCLGGSFFPEASYEKTEQMPVVVPNEPDDALADRVRALAGSLLDFSVLWLLERYMFGLGHGPAALPGLDRRAVRRLLLEQHVQATWCEECGRVSVTDPCTTCPGMVARARRTVNVATQFRLQSMRAVGRNLAFLLGDVAASELAVVNNNNNGSRGLPWAELVHLSAHLTPGPDATRQLTLDAAVDALVDELEDASSDGGSDRGPSSSSAEEHREYTDLSRQVLHFLARIMVCDAGLPLAVLGRTMRSLACMLIHPSDGRLPPRWAQDGAAGLDLGLYRQVAMAYMGLPEPAETVRELANQALDELEDVQERHENAVLDRRLCQTRDRLLGARVSYHSEVLAGPPDAEWRCCICYEAEAEGQEIVRLTRCRHVFHKDCLVQGLCHAAADRSTSCAYCRQAIDSIDHYGESVIRHQDQPWFPYGL